METPNAVREDAKQAWNKLQTLRDELRVKLHLAGMDARAEWDRIDALLPEMEKEMERTATDLSKTTRDTLRESIEDAIRGLEKFRASVEKK